MPHELIHTSAVRGLVLGTDGYCVVAETPGIPKQLRQQLERMSGYRHRVKGRQPDLTNNPVAVSHVLLNSGGQSYHVLSRIADAGYDHTNRTNYLAHHLAFTSEELPTGDPAWLAQQNRVFQTEWPSTRPPESLPASRRMPSGRATARRCETWEQVTGDGGWAGVLAASRTPVSVIYLPGQPVLELIAEALALLPDRQRWQVTYTTYYTGTFDCLWRFMPADSREAKAALEGGGPVIRLDKRMSGSPAGPLVSAARTGVALDQGDDDEDTTPMVSRRTVIDDVPTASPVTEGGRRRKPVPRDDDDFGDDESPSLTKRSRLVDDDDEETDSRPVRSKRSLPQPAGGSGKSLLLGMAFGLGLSLIFAAILELGLGKSLFRTFGVKGGAEVSLEQEQAELKRERDQAKLRGEDAETRASELGRKFKTEQTRASDLQKELETAKADLKKVSEDTKLALVQLKKSLDDAHAQKIQLKDQEIEALKKDKNTKPPEPVAQLVIRPIISGKPTQLFPPDTEAVWQFWPEQLRYFDGTGIKSDKLIYSPETGKLASIGGERTVPVFWAGAVARVTPREKGMGKHHYYFQLGEPKEISGKAVRGEKDSDKPFKLDWLKAVEPKLADQKDIVSKLDVGLAREAKVRVGTESFTLKGDLTDDKHPTVLEFKQPNKPEIRLELKGATIEVLVKTSDRNTVSEVLVEQASIVPLNVIPELKDQQPVIVRIQTR